MNGSQSGRTREQTSLFTAHIQKRHEYFSILKLIASIPSLKSELSTKNTTHCTATDQIIREGI